MTQKPRVRFAPSPTGYLHVGGARTALFNWLFARHTGGTFVLRIEDTDRERSRGELTAAILDGLGWLGLNWDEGPYHQADGLDRHRAGVDRLLASGQAYRCFCTPEELEERRRGATAASGGYMYDGRCRDLDPEEAERRGRSGQPFAVRFRMPPGETSWDDVIAGRMRFVNADIEDFVILRSDSTPTYNLAVVADDLAMNISHVIRGADHISNTPKQIQIYAALGANRPAFAHVPLILGPDGKRLSKRHGATSVEEYRKAGIVPGGMRNFLALLGWSPGEDVEYMETAELVERFSLAGVNVKPAIFDHEKLEWLNGHHIARTPVSLLAEWMNPLISDAGVASLDELDEKRDWWERVLELLKVRSRTLRDIVQGARPFFAGEVEYDPKAVAKHWKESGVTVERLRRLRVELARLGTWRQSDLEAQVRGIAEDMGLGAGKMIHPLRVALTGSAASPGIFELMELMGRELVLERIDRALVSLASPAHE